MEDLIVYDFDKTIYDGDSTLNFYFFCLLNNIFLVRYIPSQIIAFILYKLKIKNKLYFKQKFFGFLGGIKNIDKQVSDFWKLNEKKIKKWYINKGHENDVIISASPEFLLKYIFDKIEINKLIATDVDKKSGVFNSPNCYGEEKVNRMNKQFGKFKIKEFYSDSISDIHLAKLAEYSYLVKGNNINKWIIK
ncbi:MAG: polysaccharide biosynthesis protein GtrA [Clostridia bacterium]|jgi:HAD superfamily phosphoserine phosphatase-like hydrolase|nr:polysaccharide biosynthesis protein GtrA [Clostridia bacterium]